MAGNVVVVLSAVGDAAMVKATVAMKGEGHVTLRYVLHHSRISLSDGERNVRYFLTNQKPCQGT